MSMSTNQATVGSDEQSYSTTEPEVILNPLQSGQSLNQFKTLPTLGFIKSSILSASLFKSAGKIIYIILI